jgi:hypothetical protein
MATKIPPIPKVVPIPKGYRRATQKEITKDVLEFSRSALTRALPIGKQQSTVIGGKLFAALTEWHYDNHPSGSKGPPYWHPGISMLVATDTKLNKPLEVKRIPVFPIAQQGMPKSNNEFTGEPEVAFAEAGEIEDGTNASRFG